jgi:hypothetical protein
MKLLRASTALSAALLVGACISIPPGPSVMALPGTTKTAEQFRDDDWFCRNFANDHIGGVEPSEVARSSAAKGAAFGTAVGAGIGAAFGGGGGAAIGAGFGLLTGFAVGSGSGESSAYALQRRYDNAYVQCMYAKGHRVPVAGRLATPPRPSYVPPPPPPRSPSYAPPPPPRGSPPPAPPPSPSQ